MNETQNVNILGTEKVEKLLAKFAIPGIIALVVNALYNMVDQVFIGRGVGFLGNGATNVVFPLTTFTMALALMIGDGTASYMSLMLGKRAGEKAARGTIAGLLFSFVLGIALAAVYLIFLEPLCKMFGATDAILPLALDYGKIIALGLPFFFICTSYVGLIRADGSPKYNMLGLMVGFVINMIGDPLFIFVFHMGVKGAALATILGQIGNAIVNFAYIPRFKSVKLSRSLIKGSFSTLPSICKLGISSFISQVVIVAVMAVHNNALCAYGASSKYGTDIPISALGITMKVFSLLMVIVIGLATGAQPIYGYNYGSRQYDRVKKTFRIVITISTIVMFVAFLIFQFFPMAVISIFGSENDLYNEFAIKTFRIFLMFVAFTGIQLSTAIFFQSVNRPAQASVVSLSKQILFTIPAVLLLAPKIGIDAVLLSGPISDVLATITAIILLVASWKNIFAETERAPLQKTQPRINLAKSFYTIGGKPVVIFIDRTYGSNGRDFGKKISEAFSVPYYDSGLIQEAADESGLSAMFLASIDEKLPVAYFGGGASTAVNMDSVHKAAHEAQCAVIKKVTANGACVIVGRRADNVLDSNVPVFKIFINMPIEKRIESVAKSEGISPQEAKKRIDTKDKEREQFYNFYWNGKWGDSRNYDLCLDISRFSSESTIQILKAALSA